VRRLDDLLAYRMGSPPRASTREDRKPVTELVSFPDRPEASTIATAVGEGPDQVTAERIARLACYSLDD